MTDVTIEAVQADSTEGAARWDRFVESHPEASGYHLWAWREVMARVFGHRTEYLAARRGGEVAGVLPLVLFRSPLFGRFLVSVPFLNYGGIVADEPDVREALASHAGRLAREMKASHVELRHRGRTLQRLTPKTHKVTMLLRLPADPDAAWAGFDRKVRNQVRKAEKSGLTAGLAELDGLDAFYAVFAENMRDLGTPVYPKKFFATVLTTFPEHARLVLVKSGETPVAGGLTWRWRGTVEVPWASSLRSFNTMAPNNLLYWTVIREAIAGGAQTVDFGRSTPNEGTFHFKQQWGAQPEPLCWEYDLVDGVLPDQSPKNPKFRLAIAAWKQLPLWLANTLGPPIVRSIP